MPQFHILYFAWLKDRLGRSEERVSVPDGIADIAALRAWMRNRGPLFESVFAEGGRVRAAVNQDFAAETAPIAPGDEIAFFPPVTGG